MLQIFLPPFLSILFMFEQISHKCSFLRGSNNRTQNIHTYTPGHKINLPTPLHSHIYVLTFTPHKTLNVPPTTQQNYNYNVLLSIVNNQGSKNKLSTSTNPPSTPFLIHLQKLIVRRDKRCNCVLETASKMTPCTPEILMNF